MKHLLLILSATTLILAQTFTVNTLIDNSDGSCSDATCSLRDAITLSSDEDIINIEVTGTIALTAQLPSIYHAMTINGPGKTQLNIQADESFRHILHGGGELKLTNMQFSDGNLSSDPGGAIYSLNSSSILVLENMTFSNNHSNNGGAIRADTVYIKNCDFSDNSSSYLGGAIASVFLLDLENSTFNNNSAHSYGGALYISGTSNIHQCQFNNNTSITRVGGALFYGSKLPDEHNVTATTFKANAANDDPDDGNSGGYGGAIFIADTNLFINRSLFDQNYAYRNGGAIGAYESDTTSEANLSILNSTFFGNTAGYRGGAISHETTNDQLNISFSTITQNLSYQGGGGIYHQSGPINIKNSIVSHNYDDFVLNDCKTLDSSSFESFGGNIMTEKGDCPLNLALDGELGANQLELLGNNGGPTQTCAPLESSMLVNSTLNCYDLNGDTVKVDQRGIPRSDGECDIGAYEVNNIIGSLPSIYYLLLQ